MKPCVICKTTEGNTPSNQNTPARWSVRRFGFDGDACRACYNRLLRRERNDIDPATNDGKPMPQGHQGVECHLCGTTGGYVPKGRKQPKPTVGRSGGPGNTA